MAAIVVKPPDSYKDFMDDPDCIGRKFVFLAGSIAMGKAEDWQTEVEKALADENIVIMNPRRDVWPENVDQTINNITFREQVEWELFAQADADIILMYFHPETQAPITLLELGLFAGDGNLVVCCPDGFYRKGNVDIVCDAYNLPVYTDFNKAVEAVKEEIHEDD
jgi:hypothetical protein